MKGLSTFSWLGCEQPYLDKPEITQLDDVVIGRYGGCTDAGAYKNEDGALLWRDSNQGWVFAVLLDAHAGSDSLVAVLTLIEEMQEDLLRDLALPVDQAFSNLLNHLVGAFSAPSFLDRCRSLEGETACLICVQKGKCLLWLAVGDCVVYLLHPELAALGQYALNQRQFFNWIGRVNTFDGPAPSFTAGVRELRGGLNHIVMLTDGLLEFGSRPFENPKNLAEVVSRPTSHGAPSYERAIQKLLGEVHKGGGRDSATVICWGYNNTEPVSYPSG